jgi:hypothetical protein
MRNARIILIAFAAFSGLCSSVGVGEAAELTDHGFDGIQAIYVRDQAGVDNAITVDKAPGTNAARLTDPGDEFSIGKRGHPCTLSAGKHRAHCPLHKAQFATFGVFAGVGNDIVDPDLRFPRKDGHPYGLIVTGDGGDLIRGGAGQAIIVPGQGNDVARGGRGADFFRVTEADGGDRLFGGAGSDYLFYRRMHTPLRVDLRQPGFGGPQDELDWISDFEDVTGGLADDLLIGGDGRNMISGNSGNDVIRAGGGRDTISPGNGKDTVRAGAGRDYIEACCDKFKDVIRCGRGSDRAVVGPRDLTRGCERVKKGTPGPLAPFPARRTPLPEPLLRVERLFR